MGKRTFALLLLIGHVMWRWSVPESARILSAWIGREIWIVTVSVEIEKWIGWIADEFDHGHAPAHPDTWNAAVVQKEIETGNGFVIVSQKETGSAALLDEREREGSLWRGRGHRNDLAIEKSKG